MIRIDLCQKIVLLKKFEMTDLQKKKIDCFVH